MTIPTGLKALTRLFRQLGARDPAAWAAAQQADPLQLYRFLFLRQGWGLVTPVGETAWQQDAIEESRRRPDQPYAGLGTALQRCLDAGASPADLAEIVRCREAQLLFRLCYLLEDPMLAGDPDVPEALEELGWGLFPAVDGVPVGPDRISGLHESMLDLDPEGLEMRPRRP